VSNSFKKSLFFAKASIPFVLTFSLVVIPLAKSEGDEFRKIKNTDANSQTVKVLRSDANPVLANGTGGADINIEDNALVPAGVNERNQNTEKPSVSGPATDNISVYVVRPGDTLSGIAQMFSVRVSTIRGFNNIRKDTDLRAGQELLILPIDGVVYKVEKGDTLSSVAKKFKSDEMDISLFNDLPENGKLTVGEEIFIPNAEPLPPPEPVKPVAKTTNSSSNTSRTPAPASSGGSGYAAGFYIHPVPGSVKSQGFHGPYQAQDFAAREGTPIIASSAGRVIRVGFGWNGGYGNMIIIDDGVANVLYAHLSKIDVTQGQVVTQGQKIGEVGNTGRSTGPHLHIEYRGKKGSIRTPVW
jgi:murein DD-endopeptidase MepM/ murein hydrolase activator NlpD